jgi:penicillin-binding protein 1A
LLNHRHYELEVLSKIRDFRILVNLTYVARLAKELGISTQLDPVLSFPLGANSISIIEAALAYQSMMSGEIYPLHGEEDPAMVPVIKKIVARNGEVLWEYKPKPEKVLSERTCAIVNEILRKVIENGTGRTAKDAVQTLFDVEDVKVGVPVPCFGKTGTANEFANSSFVGFFPGPMTTEKTSKLTLSQGYVIASYVGYDDNRPMKSKYYSLYGSSGALPLWIDTANAVVNSPQYRAGLEPADLAFNSLGDPSAEQKGYQKVTVSPISGLPLNLAEGETGPANFPRVLTDLENREGIVSLRRSFEPIEGDSE